LYAKGVLEADATQTPGIIQPSHAAATFTQQTTLADEAETAQRHVEDKQGVYCDANAVPDHPRPAHDAHTRCQRPRDEDEVDGHPDDDGNANGAEERGDDEREERVADDGDGLKEGAGQD
jgi:hypothetical protein